MSLVRAQSAEARWAASRATREMVRRPSGSSSASGRRGWMGVRLCGSGPAGGSARERSGVRWAGQKRNTAAGAASLPSGTAAPSPMTLPS